MNTFVERMESIENFVSSVKRTENGALAYNTTFHEVYDMFAFGGAYRQRTDEDCIKLFKKAFKEESILATKCLFYLRDVRGGQGERRFFRVCFRWLIKNHEDVARTLLPLISEYGRWDDLIEVCYRTSLWIPAMTIVTKQLTEDLKNENCSLLAKWLPSANASSKETKRKANAIMQSLGMSPRIYRKMLSRLRKKINVLERLMSANDWEDIEFDKIPSRAGLLYKDAFARRNEIAHKYREFINSKNTKVNASVLYPYEIIGKIGREIWNTNSTIDKAVLDKYWNNLPDYFNGEGNSIMCVCDTSASMTVKIGSVRPIEVAIGLSIYAAEHINRPFKNRFISFSERPVFHTIKGDDIVEKARSIYQKSEVASTNLEAVFDLLRDGCNDGNWDPEDMPKTLVVISDMEINMGVDDLYCCQRGDAKEHLNSLMEKIRMKWITDGLGDYYPNLVYWNVNARNDTILDLGEGVSYVSGCSPVLFEQIVRGKNGYDLMMDKLLSERYEKIKF